MTGETAQSHIVFVGRDPCPAADAPVGASDLSIRQEPGEGAPARLGGAAPRYPSGNWLFSIPIKEGT
jgi:hypothetical protein